MPEVIKPVEMHRLSSESYAKLEAQVANANVDNETSPIAAGFKLGVQAVLKALRTGYVVG